LPLPPACKAFCLTPSWWVARRRLCTPNTDCPPTPIMCRLTLQQLQIQLSNPLPYDLEEMNLAEYKHLYFRWHDWEAVKAACADFAMLIFDRILGLE
jgi:hypothetical protein